MAPRITARCPSPCLVSAAQSPSPVSKPSQATHTEPTREHGMGGASPTSSSRQQAVACSQAYSFDSERDLRPSRIREPESVVARHTRRRSHPARLLLRHTAQRTNPMPSSYSSALAYNSTYTPLHHIPICPHPCPCSRPRPPHGGGADRANAGLSLGSLGAVTQWRPPAPPTSVFCFHRPPIQWLG